MRWGYHIISWCGVVWCGVEKGVFRLGVPGVPGGVFLGRVWREERERERERERAKSIVFFFFFFEKKGLGE